MLASAIRDTLVSILVLVAGAVLRDYATNNRNIVFILVSILVLVAGAVLRWI